MRCPTLQQIYLYLEKELVPSENQKIEEHLRSCSKCKKALEERKFLLKAVESFPSWQVPPGFTQQVMDKIFLTKVSFWRWLAVSAVGFLSFILSTYIYLEATGQNLSSLSISFYHTLWNQIKSISLILIKLFKLVSLSLKILYQLGQLILKGFLQLTTVVSPEVQILTITILIIITTLIYGMGRKFLAGEK